MTTISATTVLRSRNAARPDKILTTLLLRYPRWIHAELMTHRVFSRNAASSRAIPVEKLIDDILRDPAMPIYWGKNQRGMQALEECNAPVELGEEMAVTGIGEYPVPKTLTREEAWLEARDRAIEVARAFDAAGYHKQVVNRLLEPFAHITVVVSSTEWDNFLELRDHPDAEPHIRMLAREIRKCLEDESTVQTLMPGEWHLPFVRDEDRFIEVAEQDVDHYPHEQEIVVTNFVNREVAIGDLIKLSVARCASTSYKTVEGFDMTLERAKKLHDKLLAAEPIHASPAEHVARADDWEPIIGWLCPEHHGNFVGFCQYRKQIESDNRHLDLAAE